MGFLDELKANGAVVIASPADIVTGVAEGRQKAGVSIDKLVRDAVAQGAPVDLIWPAPGAVAVYSPVAILAESDASPAAETFVEFLVSSEGQAAIAATGWQPVRPDAPGPATSGRS